MKKLFIILGVLAVGLWVVWSLMRRSPKATTSAITENARPAEQTELTPVHPPPTRTNQFDLSRHTSAPEVEMQTGRPDREAMLERLKAARERWRQELKAQDAYKEIFAKEDEWKTKSLSLVKGMTRQQVVAVMGLPTHVETFVETDAGVEMTAVPTNSFSEFKIRHFARVYYSPDGKAPENLLVTSASRSMREMPFDHLGLSLDGEGKLANIGWIELGLGAAGVRASERTNTSAPP